MRIRQRSLLIGLSVAATAAIGWIALELDRTEPESTNGLSSVPISSTHSGNGSGADGRVPSIPLEDAHGAAGANAGDGDRAGPATDFRFTGRVVGRGGKPIQGARIRIELETAGNVRELARAESDADGRYAARAPELSELDHQTRSLANVWVAVEAAGFQPQKQRRAAGQSDEHGRTFTIDFRLTAGNTLSGRVVDSSGKAVHGASVVLFVGALGDSPGQRQPRTEVSSGPDGRFELGFTSGGSYRLWARKNGSGSARLDELELAADEDRRLGDVALTGAGKLCGTVRYPNGAPVRDLELWAVPQALAHETNALSLAASRAAELEGGDGLCYGSSSTNARGEFCVQGLRAAGYVLRLSKVHLQLEPRTAHYQAPAESIGLVLDAYWLRVRVRSSTGAALSGAVVSCTAVEPQADGNLEAGSTSHATAAGRDALATFEVLPDQTYALSARAPGSREAEELVIVAPGEFEVERTLVLEPALEPGRLRITVSGERGESLGGLRVALLSPLSAKPIAELGVMIPDEQGWLPPLTPGRYGVEVGFELELDRPPMHFPVRSRDAVEVESGRDRELALAARAGGRLSLALSIEGPLPRDFAPPDPRTTDDAQREAWIAENGARARLIHSDGHASVALQFLKPPNAPPGGPQLCGQLAPGDAALVEQLLEPGLYTLRVEAPNFRPIDTPVEVIAGSVRRVDVALRAE